VTIRDDSPLLAEQARGSVTLTKDEFEGKVAYIRHHHNGCDALDVNLEHARYSFSSWTAVGCGPPVGAAPDRTGSPSNVKNQTLAIVKRGDNELQHVLPCFHFLWGCSTTYKVALEEGQFDFLSSAKGWFDLRVRTNNLELDLASIANVPGAENEVGNLERFGFVPGAAFNFAKIDGAGVDVTQLAEAGFLHGGAFHCRRADILRPANRNQYPAALTTFVEPFGFSAELVTKSCADISVGRPLDRPSRGFIPSAGIGDFVCMLRYGDETGMEHLLSIYLPMQIDSASGAIVPKNVASGCIDGSSFQLTRKN